MVINLSKRRVRMEKRERNKRTKRKAIKQKKSIVDFIMSQKEFMMVILGICTVVYPLINNVYKKVYQISCEKFYGLPGKYFDSNIDTRLWYVGGILVLLLMYLMPVFLKKFYEKRKKIEKRYFVKTETIFWCIIIGLAIGLFNVYNLLEIMKQTHKTNNFFRTINYWLNSNAGFTVDRVIGLGLFSAFGITYIDKLQAIIKRKWFENLICIIVSVSFVMSLLLMFYGTMFKLSISIEDKTKYEFVTYEREYVVLSMYKEKLLIVPYEINEKGQYIFKTNQYLFGEPYKGTYQYRDIKYSPKIATSTEK